MGVSTHGLIIAALVTWTVTELCGVNLLVRGRAYLLWQRLRRRLPAALPVPTGLPGIPGRATGRAERPHRPHRAPRAPRAPRAMAILILLHITFAACGLTLWLLYVLSDRNELLYVSAGLLVVVVAIGFSVVDRWRHVPGRHASREPQGSQGPGAHGSQAAGPPGPLFPIWSATAHVMAGTATFVLVLLALLADHND